MNAVIPDPLVERVLPLLRPRGRPVSRATSSDASPWRFNRRNSGCCGSNADRPLRALGIAKSRISRHPTSHRREAARQRWPLKSSFYKLDRSADFFSTGMRSEHQQSGAASETLGITASNCRGDVERSGRLASTVRSDSKADHQKSIRANEGEGNADEIFGVLRWLRQSLSRRRALGRCRRKKYGPGVTHTEIKIGQIMPYSGPASLHTAP